MATHSSILAWKIPWIFQSLAVYHPWDHKSGTQLSDSTNHKDKFRNSLFYICFFLKFRMGLGALEALSPGHSPESPVTHEARCWDSAWETRTFKPDNYKMLPQMCKSILGAVPNLCCLCAENCQTVSHSRTPGEWHQCVCLCRDSSNLKRVLKNFADEFARLQDYWQAEVERFEVKVLAETLKAYGTIVKIK